MPSPAEPPIDTGELMASIRAALAPGTAATDAGPGTPVVLSPHLHQEQLLLDQAQRVAAIGTVVPPFGGLPSLLRPVARLTTWILYRPLQVVTVDQRVFNSLLLNVVRMATMGLAEGETALHAHLGAAETAQAASRRRFDEIEEAIHAAQRRLGEVEEAAHATQRRLGEIEEATHATQQRLDALEGAATAAARRLDDIQAAAVDLQHTVTARSREQAALIGRIAAQERGLIGLSKRAGPSKRAGDAAVAPPAAALADAAAHALDALYVELEEHFRGSASDVTERLGVYLPDVRAVIGPEGGRVLDLGCGRGEWLLLLREEGISARGIDANRVLVSQCRAAGLDVTEGDVSQQLAAVPDASMDVVTAFHLIEHLDYPFMVALLDHAVRILRPGGLLILETPNPDNVLVGSGSFYLDPTHQHPLPAPLLRFLAEARGLHEVEIRPLHPAPAYARFTGACEIATPLNEYFFGPRDYALLGHRP